VNRALPAPTLTDAQAAFWERFLAVTGRPAATPLTDVFFFADNETDATELADLVLAGRKAATASLVWSYEAEGSRPPAAGDLSLVTAFDGRPLCVIETTSVDIHGFDDVSADFAAAEGEGDLSLAWWRRAHRDYFGRECARFGRRPTDDMPVVCEHFHVLDRA